MNDHSHSVWEYEVEDDDVEDDDVKGEEDDELMLRRKVMMLRMMMLRRKTDPKTGKHTLCEPAQSKCTWTCHKRHFVQKFSGKMPNAPDTTSVEHRALTLTVRTPLCGHTVWGPTIGKENKKDRNAYEIKRK